MVVRKCSKSYEGVLFIVEGKVIDSEEWWRGFRIIGIYIRLVVAEMGISILVIVWFYV